MTWTPSIVHSRGSLNRSGCCQTRSTVTFLIAVPVGESPCLKTEVSTGQPVLIADPCLIHLARFTWPGRDCGDRRAGQGSARSTQTKADELEDFKYDIQSEKGWVGPGGSAKEATVKQLPVSETIAGVSMKLDPGAIRELHWHALAAEWAYVLTG